DPGEEAARDPGRRLSRPVEADDERARIGDTRPTDDELAVVSRQLGRTPRGVNAVAHRCPCGQPDVVETLPALPDGPPFATLYYLTCPRATSAVSRLEAAGMMAEQSERLAADGNLRSRY